MSINTTVMIPVAVEVTQFDFPRELAYRIYITLRYVLIPCTSVLGIAGNVISIVILTRQGFQKCSSILLMALAVADVLFLTGKINFPMYIYTANHRGEFMFSERVNMLLYIISRLFYCADYVGIHAATFIPVLITGERLLAICCPFHVHLILTPQRVIISVSCMYILGATYFVYTNILCIQFVQFNFENVTFGQIKNTDLYFRAIESGLDELIGNIVNYITGIIPLSLVTAGCIFIGINVILITNRRKQLTLSHDKVITKHTTSKTTKTLLSICVLYIVCSGFAFAFGYLMNYGLLDHNGPLQSDLMALQDWVLCLNCVGDFIIYVGANNKYGFSTICPIRLRRLRESFN